MEAVAVRCGRFPPHCPSAVLAAAIMAAVMTAMLSTPPCARAAPATAADFYVSPQGKDAWSGRLAAPSAAGTDGPLASVERAQEKVRKLRQAEPERKGPIVVAIRGGTFYLDRPLVFRPQDSGADLSPTVYAAYGRERPVFSGGVRLGGWQIDRQGRWNVVLEDVKRGNWSFAQLFVNDQRRFRPVLPKQGYYLIAKELPPSPPAAGKGQDRFGYSGNDLRADWANRGDVEVMAFHEWFVSRLRIAALDANRHVVTFTGHTAYTDSWSSFHRGYRFLVFNVREALAEPGQWYLDRPGGRLTYIPRPGEQPGNTVVIAPRLVRLVSFEGDLAKRQWVEHVQFHGLSFAHSNWTLPPEGRSCPQAESTLEAAISAVGARNVVIDGCAVRQAGGYAVALGACCRDDRIENCEMVDLGGGGVKIGDAGGHTFDEMCHAGKPEDIASHNVVRQCLIAHGGRVHPGSIGVWIGHSHHNVIEHNDIYDLYYTGISVGWIWGYGPSAAQCNDIGFNRIHKIGQSLLSDMGGIYTLGISPGTRCHHNAIWDVGCYRYGGWGLYCDEGSSGITMDCNLVYRTQSGGLHQHCGKENRIENNIFAFGGDQQLQRTRGEPHTSFFFQRNIVYWASGSPLLAGNWGDNHFRLDYNLYWNGGGKPILFADGLGLGQWQRQRGQDVHSLVADPLFIDPGRDDFRLKPGSPATKIGFQPFDYRRAGRTAPAVLTKDLPPVPAAYGEGKQ